MGWIRVDRMMVKGVGKSINVLFDNDWYNDGNQWGLIGLGEGGLQEILHLVPSMRMVSGHDGSWLPYLKG